MDRLVHVPATDQLGNEIRAALAQHLLQQRRVRRRPFLLVVNQLVSNDVGKRVDGQEDAGRPVIEFIQGRTLGPPEHVHADQQAAAANGAGGVHAAHHDVDVGEDRVGIDFLEAREGFAHRFGTACDLGIETSQACVVAGARIDHAHQFLHVADARLDEVAQPRRALFKIKTPEGVRARLTLEAVSRVPGLPEALHVGYHDQHAFRSIGKPGSRAGRGGQDDDDDGNTLQKYLHDPVPSG